MKFLLDLLAVFKKNILYIVICDLIFVLALKILPLPFDAIMDTDPIVEFTGSANPAAITAQEIPEHLMAKTHLFVLKFVGLGLLLLLAIYFSYTFTRAVLWHIIAHRKIDGKFFGLFSKGLALYFLCIALPYMLVFSLIMMILALIIPSQTFLQVVLLIIGLFFVHMTFVFSYQLTQRKQIKQALFDLYPMAVKRWWQFVPLHVLCICVLVGLTFIARLIVQALSQTAYWEMTGNVLIITIMLCYFAWLRYGTVDIVKKII